VTLAELIPAGASFSFHLNGETPPYEVQKRDLINNLALVKFDAYNLPTLEFAADRAKIGERVFLIGAIFDARGQVLKSVNEGIIKRIEGERIVSNIVEEKRMSGSVLFDVEGRVLGINMVSAKGEVTAVPISTVREFVGL